MINSQLCRGRTGHSDTQRTECLASPGAGEGQMRGRDPDELRGALTALPAGSWLGEARASNFYPLRILASHLHFYTISGKDLCFLFQLHRSRHTGSFGDLPWEGRFRVPNAPGLGGGPHWCPCGPQRPRAIVPRSSSVSRHVCTAGSSPAPLGKR